MGVPWASPLQQLKNEQGNAMLRFVLACVTACLETETLFLVENPDSSWIWRQVGDLSWETIFSAYPFVGDFRVDYCSVAQENQV